MRFRIVNGANASNFNLKLDNRDGFYQIASDGGFLEKPVSKRNIMLSPGKRAEIIVDFSKYEKGTQLSLWVIRKPLWPFNVKGDGKMILKVPSTLTNIERMSEAQATKIRSFELQGMGHMVSINGKSLIWIELMKQLKLGDTDLGITNPGSMMHEMGQPFHIHSTQVQILSRNGNA